MAPRNVHLEQARYNEALAEALREDYPDWAITVAFYAGVHYVEAEFAARKTHTKSDEGHVGREKRLSQGQGKYVCFVALKGLRTASENVRYLEDWRHQSGTAREWYTEQEVRSLIQVNLANIKQDLNITD